MRISDWSSDVCSSDLAGGAADGEVAHREYVRQHRIAHRAGVEIVHAAVALLPGIGARDIQSVGQRVPHAAGLEVLAQVQLPAVEALVDVELALAALVGAAGCSATLDAVPGGLADRARGGGGK